MQFNAIGLGWVLSVDIELDDDSVAVARTKRAIRNPTSKHHNVHDNLVSPRRNSRLVTNQILARLRSNRSTRPVGNPETAAPVAQRAVQPAAGGVPRWGEDRQRGYPRWQKANDRHGAPVTVNNGSMARSSPAPVPQSEEAPVNAAGLAALDADICACRLCPRLVAWRELVAVEKRAAYRHETYWGQGVPGFGDAGASLLVLGLAPAAHGANRTGRVFTGDRSGDWLFRALYRAGVATQPTSLRLDDGLALTGAWVAAAVRCAPPGNKPEPQERTNCLPFLHREVRLLPQLRAILVLGKFAYDVARRDLTSTISKTAKAPKFGHGVETSITLFDGRAVDVVCSYHPSQQNTFTGTLTEPMLDAVVGRAAHLAGLRAPQR